LQKRVLILHGWGGSDYPHWQAKLASKIACNYGIVSFPLLKNPHFPTLKNWLKQLDSEIKTFKPNIIVCHSLANTLWFWYANEHKYTVDKLYLVAMPSLETKEETIKSFFPCPTPASLNAKEAIFVSSSDDKWCNTKEVQAIAKKYGAKLKVLQNAGHINANSGFGDWEWMQEQFNLKREC
jgi:predicted alpha/beta hydrolase family esterase